ncbi:MAG: hypothetical protein CM1200mP40_32950 [Gammaproteobacteria bacterium]|nr:MAG: hypothetical protein CM1200mP40_32950 [Gammaproteobacteria bacterium]
MQLEKELSFGVYIQAILKCDSSRIQGRLVNAYTWVFSNKVLLNVLVVLSLSHHTHSHAQPILGSSLEDFFNAAINFSTELRISEENLKIGSARKKAASGQFYRK